MLDKLTHKDLLILTSVHEGPCASIYLPNMPERNLAEEYNALVGRASHLLSFDKNKEAASLIQRHLRNFNPSEYLLEEDEGIAVFVNKTWAGYFLPSHEVPMKVVVAETFHLKPLLQDLKRQNIFHILAITTHEAVLLNCDGNRCSEAHNFLFQYGSHSNSVDWKHGDEEERFQMPHTKVTTRGRGLQDNKGKKRTTVKIFLRWMESKINKELTYKSAPLFVFTNDGLFDLYNEITTHSSPTFNKIDATQIPSTESMVHKAHEVLSKEIQVKEKRLAAEAKKEIESSKPRIISDLLRISRAALNGKVETLFLREDIEIWGQLRKGGDITFIEKQSSSKDDDVLDDIACEVIRQGGEVVVLKDKDMPTNTVAAALINT